MPARVREDPHASVWRSSRPWRSASKCDKASVSSKTAVDSEALSSGFRVLEPARRPAASENATRHHGRIDILENSHGIVVRIDRTTGRAGYASRHEANGCTCGCPGRAPRRSSPTRASRPLCPMGGACEGTCVIPAGEPDVSVDAVHLYKCCRKSSAPLPISG
jgi:hypothetical protein